MAAGPYRKGRARAELLGATLRGAGRGVTRAVGQRVVPGAGVNLLGYGPAGPIALRELMGVVGAGLADLPVPVVAHDVAIAGAAPAAATSRFVHHATVAVVQSGHLPTAAAQHPRLFGPSRAVAGVFHYEVPQLPLPQRLGLPMVDEVWTTSGFVRDIFAGATRTPVRVAPLPIAAPAGTPGTMRRHLGLRDQFVFGYHFDLASSGRRKNPQAVVRAYLAAVPTPAADVRLLLKSVHGSADPATSRAVRMLAADRPDIVIVDEYWPRPVNDAFFLDIDAYVSLHRAEGYGVTVARAMAAGAAVIATDYSGTTQFVDPGCAIAVPYRLVPVGPDPVYPAHGRWAEPDMDHAADAMRALLADRDRARRLGAAGRHHVLSQWTPARFTAWLRAHLPR